MNERSYVAREPSFRPTPFRPTGFGPKLFVQSYFHPFGFRPWLIFVQNCFRPNSKVRLD